ncbi:Uncharacterised protein [Bordetella pertussis]|nr:Uncharacterised protein [Bordetella pertussis]
MPSRFWRKRPLLPLIMSASDLSWRLLAPVMALPRRPLSSSESTASCSMRFSLRRMISGAFSSSRRLRRLLRLMTRRYRSFRSEVAKRPPSSGTSGRRSGGNTGSTSMTIHSALMPDFWKPSSTFRRLEIFLILASELVALSSPRSVSTSRSMSMVRSSSRTASAPIRARKSSPYSSVLARKSSSDMIWPRLSGVMPGSITHQASKYSTRSMSRSVMSSTMPRRDGRLLRNQMCATGLASSIWPMRSRRTLATVTSTPHFSQITPRCFRRLYLPHKHS